MSNFASGTLKRTFATIWFGTVVGAAPGGAPMMGGGAPATDPHKGLMPGAMGSGATAGAMAAVQKAEGPLGLRVADIYSERQALSGKTVRVRGMVTKVSPVQGLNYVHVKDGSGSTATADDDLLVTTTQTVKAGEVSTLEGRVVVDKDIGMGPRPVMLEQGTVAGN
jgi:hypothetical protein